MNKKLEFKYDPEADAAYIQLRPGQVDHTVDLEQVPLNLPVLVDVDHSGRVIGIEILAVSATVGLMN